MRVGLIGFGLAGKAFHAPWIHALEGVQLAAVATTRRDEVEAVYPQARVYLSPESLLADEQLDLVVIASPNATHFLLARAALEAGCHVIVDKPLVTRSQDAEELIALARRQQRLLVPFHNRRWDNDYLTLCDCIDQGWLGEVRTWESRFDRFRPHIKAGWREQPEEGAGILYDLGPHLIDQVIARLGLPEWVFADVHAQRDQARVDDYFHLVLAWGPTRALLHAGTLVAGDTPRFSVHGTRGAFVAYGRDPQEAALRAGKVPGVPGWCGDPEACQGFLSVRGEPAQPMPLMPGDYGAFYRQVAGAVQHGAPPPVAAEAARDGLRVLEAAQCSQREGRRIRVA